MNAIKRLSAIAVILFGLVLGGKAATTNVYFTQFELAEGYNTNLTLIGQAGWIGSGDGDNGVVNQYLAGQGQQGLVGGFAPLPADRETFVWRPLDFNPVAAGYPIVRFTVLMNIADSLNSQWDTFSWSVFNTQGHELFSLDFDNFPGNLDIGYTLDNTNQAIFTNVKYVNNSNYTLTVTMNFASNLWSASLNSALIATNLKMTVTNALLTLGDIDAVWRVYSTNAPGDNYMLFDNYRVVALNTNITPARVQLLGRTTQGVSQLRVTGDDGARWALEGTTNFVNWTALNTNTISGTSFDTTDPGAVGLSRRFYRTRHVP